MKKVEKINLAKKAAQLMEKGENPKAQLKTLKNEGCHFTKDTKGYHFEDSDGKGYQLIPMGNMVAQYSREDWLEYRAVNEVLASSRGKAATKKAIELMENVKAKSLREDLTRQIEARGAKKAAPKKAKVEEKPKAEEKLAEKPKKAKVEVLPKNKQEQAVKKLMTELKDVKFEVIGVENWVWASGNTKTHAAELKRAGFLFSGRKQAWYWKPEGSSSQYRKSRFKTMDGMRNYWSNAA